MIRHDPEIEESREKVHCAVVLSLDEGRNDQARAPSEETTTQ
jgi:hypothetical protein